MSETQEEYGSMDGSIENENRIDEFAINAFKDMGFTELLSDEMVETYKEFKRYRDKLMPGRLGPGEFAAIVVIAGVRESMRPKNKKAGS